MTAIALGATLGALGGILLATATGGKDPFTMFLVSLCTTLGALWGWGV